MITEEQKKYIADDLENYFETRLMMPVKKIYGEIKKCYDQHIASGGYTVCNEAKINYEQFLNAEDHPYWDKIWFHPHYNTNNTFVSFTKGLGEGCHFGDENTVESFYNRFHDKIFGSHFHPTTWGGYEGYNTRKTALEFVNENINHPDIIIGVKAEIDMIAEGRIYELKFLPSIIKNALIQSVALAKKTIANNDNRLLESFGLVGQMK